MRKFFVAGVLALSSCGATVAAANETPIEDITVETAALETVGPPCQLPTTKVYRINPGFCPQALVCLIPKAVGPSCCGCECGPYGIPPIYASGQNVLVRQTPEMHERITEFLTEMGALVPKKR